MCPYLTSACPLLPILLHTKYDDILWGWQLKDEPAARDFPSLRNWTSQIVADGHKGKLRYINLLPFCGPAQLNATSYEAYVTGEAGAKGAHMWRTLLPPLLLCSLSPEVHKAP